MKRTIILSAIAFVALSPMAARADMYTMHTANVLSGNQAWSSVGLTFDVNPGPGIRVLELGIYDSAQDGIQGGATLSTVIFDAAQTPLVQMDFAAGDSSTLVGAYLFKPLATPLVLAPGRYTIAGYGFHLGGNNEYNANFTHTGWPTFDDGGGLISFVDSVWGTGSDVPPTYPVWSGATTVHGVADYFDGPNMVFVPVPGAVLLGMIGLSLAGVKLRKFA